MENPGLKDYDLTAYKGTGNKNFYAIDFALKRMIERYSNDLSTDHKKAIEVHLNGYGELVGGIINELTEKSHKEGKYGEIVQFDKLGNRINEIAYCAEQNESRKISYEYGVVNLDFHSNWKHTFTGFHRYALAYLMNLNGEGGVSCPLAMTDGLIYALKKIGTQEQKEKYLPLIAGEKSNSHFLVGQYITERVGGSNVGANRTIARKAENGKWILTGEKWFCSNPGDVWVTTAKLHDSQVVGLFLVSRTKEDGSLNGIELLRKKDIIGSRGKVTAEAIYEDLEAEELGRPAHGLVNLIKYILKISRLHVGIGATGNARRALLEALEYSKFRTAYGKKISKFPIYAKTLAELQILQTAITFCNFRSIQLMEAEDLAEDVTVPLLKYKSSSQATFVCLQSVLSLGGNGILGDFSPIPRMLNDSIINETWEGTHFLLTEHTLRALERPKSQKAFLNLLSRNISGVENFRELEKPYLLFKKKLTNLKDWLEKSKEFKDINRINIIEEAYSCFAISEFIQESIFDSKNGLKDSIYTIFAKGYTDILTFGFGGVLEDDSILLSESIRQRILDFGMGQ